MTKLSPADHIRTVSFDIDGTVYPIRRIQLRWWKNFLLSPSRALRFYGIKKTWEKRRLGGTGPVLSDDVKFFEAYLAGMLDPSLVPLSVLEDLLELSQRGLRIFFLSDHGAEMKLRKLGLTGTPINCLTETGQLKPHAAISDLLVKKYGIDPSAHLHLGDRWSDEEQAKLFGCEFRYYRP